MATASEEFLVRLRYWLVSGGMMMRMACGMTTRRSDWPLRQADRQRRLLLALGHALDAGAHDLGDEACRVDRQAQQQGHELGLQHHAALEIEALELGIVEAERLAEQR